MKKNFKRILSVGLIALSLGLASCTKVTQKYADKINDAYKNEKPLNKGKSLQFNLQNANIAEFVIIMDYKQ